ncbi:hypothetical protein sce3108 [Sorangium cellulosum So ce56]|uniref:Protein kinase domain-containing protein n=1 Tax=Sorangium cellulosum (strain So ce56) TaxID=448385 RepID=A9GIH6_SORC5|nr:hypothetical protein [Sorangium cellulosum]CAN93267.1 hypothetical protein sce3108 [Sorangium cellulosum So ce56]
MGSEALRDEAPERAPRESGRCPACGRRNQGACPECAQPARPPAGQSSIPPDITEVVPISLPRFPGYWTRRTLGKGGFGLVFEAEPEGGGAHVAIKLARAGPEHYGGAGARSAGALGRSGTASDRGGGAPCPRTRRRSG